MEIINDKEKIFAEEKKRIGTAAAQLIEPNDSIMLTSGSTVLAMARAIEPAGSLTVITAALNVALELVKNARIEVFQLGGTIRHSSTSVIGIHAERILAETSCSKLFLGADGIDLDFGLSTTNLSEARLNQQMIISVQEVIVLADSSKFGKRGFGKVCDLNQITRIITDTGISDEVAQKIERLGVMLTIV